jgi:hypothetical protein
MKWQQWRNGNNNLKIMKNMVIIEESNEINISINEINENIEESIEERQCNEMKHGENENVKMKEKSKSAESVIKREM